MFRGSSLLRTAAAGAGRNVLVMGGAGALGRSVVQRFNAAGWHTFSHDVYPNKEAAIDLEGVLSGDEFADNPLSAVVCVAGGWVGGDSASLTLVKDVQPMLASSVVPSVRAVEIAQEQAAAGAGRRPLLVLAGAAPLLGGAPTPAMLPYGLAKAAVHHLLASVSVDASAGFHAVGIAPHTLDTPMNRKHMPDAAPFAAWTPLEEVADKLVEWASSEASRPVHGAMVEIVTAGGSTEWKAHKA